MTMIAVTNLSSRISDADASLMTRACQFQLTKHAAPLLQRKSWKVKFFKKGTTPPVDSFPMVIMDDPDQANALGYHTTDDKGNPWGRVFASPVLDNGGTALRGSMSVSAVLSHEVLEVFGDYNVNLWADKYDGSEVAVELCDPVEADCYDVLVGKSQVPVSVSNFVLDEWFDAFQVEAKFDYMGTVSAPLQMSKGGYTIVRNLSSGQVSAVWGSKEAEQMHALRKPGHPAARTSKRTVTR
jgi:hypothetical protein